VKGQTDIFDMTFDLELGQQLREQGMQRSLESMAAMPWSERADAWLAAQPRGSEFHADDLTQAIGLPASGANKNNGIGGWFGAKSKTGQIRPTGRSRKSVRASRHATSPTPIWRVV
jgi:hypothetical protein